MKLHLGSLTAVALATALAVGVMQSALVQPSFAGTVDLSSLPAAAHGPRARAAEGQRLVILDADLAEIAAVLGMGEAVVAAPGSSVGGAISPELEIAQGISPEAIAALTPTLVLGSNPGDSGHMMRSLSPFGLKTILIDRSLPAPEKIRRFGRATGTETEAEKLATSIEAQYAEVAQLEPMQPAPRVVFLSTRGGGSGRINSAGAGTSTDLILSRAGAENVAALAGLKSFRSLSTEALISLAPEVVVVAADELETLGGENGIWNRVAGLAQTPAGMERNLIVMRSEHIRNDGPSSGDATKALRQALETIRQ